MEEAITKNDEGTVVVKETAPKAQKGDTRSFRITTTEDAEMLSRLLDKSGKGLTEVVLSALRRADQEEAFPTSHENERNRVINYLKGFEPFLANIFLQWDSESEHARQEFAKELDQKKKLIDMLVNEKISLQTQVAALTKSLEDANAEREQAVQNQKASSALVQDLTRQLDNQKEELAAARETRVLYEEVRQKLEAAKIKIAELNGKLEVYTSK